MWSELKWVNIHVVPATRKVKAKAIPYCSRYNVSRCTLAGKKEEKFMRQFSLDYTIAIFILSPIFPNRCSDLSCRTSSKIQCRSWRNSANSVRGRGHPERHWVRLEVQHIGTWSAGHAIVNCEEQRHQKRHTLQADDGACKSSTEIFELQIVLMFVLTFFCNHICRITERFCVGAAMSLAHRKILAPLQLFRLVSWTGCCKVSR